MIATPEPEIEIETKGVTIKIYKEHSNFTARWQKDGKEHGLHCGNLSQLLKIALAHI